MVSRRALLVPVIALLAAASCAAVEGHRPISLVHVLTNPGPLKNEMISVSGYLGDDLQLYLTAEHAKAYDVESSLLVSHEIRDDRARSSCTDNFVTIIGKLVEDKPQIYALEDISRIYVPKSKEVCYERDIRVKKRR